MTSTTGKMMHVAAWGVTILASLFIPGAGFVLVRLQGPEVILALPPLHLAVILAALFLPPCLLMLIFTWLTQRIELATLTENLLRQTTIFCNQRALSETLVEEVRAQSALMQEQLRTAAADRVTERRATQLLFQETRTVRQIAEWNLVVSELGGILVAMWRLTHGWTEPGAEARYSPMPPPEELPLHILRLLPVTPKEMAKYDIDERFVRQAARYRAVFQAFLEQVPETGKLSRTAFRQLVYGQLDARLALLPRPNHGEIVEPWTLAAEPYPEQDSLIDRS
jgi:hypothetical protein